MSACNSQIVNFHQTTSSIFAQSSHSLGSDGTDSTSITTTSVRVCSAVQEQLLGPCTAVSCQVQPAPRPYPNEGTIHAALDEVLLFQLIEIIISYSTEKEEVDSLIKKKFFDENVNEEEIKHVKAAFVNDAIEKLSAVPFRAENIYVPDIIFEIFARHTDRSSVDGDHTGANSKDQLSLCIPIPARKFCDERWNIHPYIQERENHGDGRRYVRNLDLPALIANVVASYLYPAAATLPYLECYYPISETHFTNYVLSPREVRIWWNIMDVIHSFDDVQKAPKIRRLLNEVAEFQIRSGLADLKFPLTKILINSFPKEISLLISAYSFTFYEFLYASTAMYIWNENRSKTVNVIDCSIISETFNAVESLKKLEGYSHSENYTDLLKVLEIFVNEIGGFHCFGSFAFNQQNWKQFALITYRFDELMNPRFKTPQEDLLKRHQVLYDNPLTDIVYTINRCIPYKRYTWFKNDVDALTARIFGPLDCTLNYVVAFLTKTFIDNKILYSDPILAINFNGEYGLFFNMEIDEHFKIIQNALYQLDCNVFRTPLFKNLHYYELRVPHDLRIFFGTNFNNLFEGCYLDHLVPTKAKSTSSCNIM